MTVGRFFANSSVDLGLTLVAANTLFAQSDWGYPLVGEKPVPTTDEIKQIVEGGWFGWPIWAWVGIVLGILALILILIMWRRRGNSAPPPPPPSEGWNGKSLGIINPPPPSPPPPPPSEKSDEKQKEKEGEPATRVRWQIKRKVERKAEEDKKPSETTPPPSALTPTVEVVDAPREEPSPVVPPPPPEDLVPDSNCPQCRASIEEGQKFCTYCGWDLSAASVEPTQEEVGEPVPPSENSGEKKDEQKGKVAASAASAATGVVVVALLMFGFAGFANAAPTIDYCTPPLLAWDGQPRTFECVGTGLQGLAGAKVTNIPEVSGTVFRSTATTATLRLVAVRNLSASYNSVDFSLNGQRVGKPIMLVSPQEAGRLAFLRNAILREAKMLPVTTGAGTSTTTVPAVVVDAHARKDAAEALRIAREALARSGKSDPSLVSRITERITELEESLKTRLTEAEIRTISRNEATTATAALRSDLDGAKREMAETIKTARNEMRTSVEKVEATTRAVDGRVTTLETNATRDRTVLQATACAVVADNGGFLGQGPSNRHKRAIRTAATSAGYAPCPKK